MKKRWADAMPVLSVLSLLVLWEAAVRLAGIPLYVLPAPTKVLRTLVAESRVLALHAGVTVGEALLGMAIALAAALVLGVWMDARPLAKRCVYPLLVVTQTVPMLALAPIFIIYLGFGMAPKILTVVLMCFFPIAVSFCDGMGTLDAGYVHLVRAYGARPWQVYTLVKVPWALPALFSGLKVAATYSIGGAIVGEWVGAQRGLGYYLLRVKNGYMLDKVFACVLVIVLLSLGMNGLIRLGQRWLAPYTADTRAG